MAPLIYAAKRGTNAPSARGMSSKKKHQGPTSVPVAPTCCKNHTVSVAARKVMTMFATHFNRSLMTCFTLNKIVCLTTEALPPAKHA